MKRLSTSVSARAVVLAAMILTVCLLLAQATAQGAVQAAGHPAAPTAIAGTAALSTTPTAIAGTAALSTTPAAIAGTAALSTTPTAIAGTAEVVLMAIGDIILHQSVIDGGRKADGTWNFDPAFADTKAILSSADLTVAGYEGTLNGPPYSGYPLFGGPDAIADAMAAAGIDVVTTANNHALDRKLAGLVRTPTVLAKAGMRVVGTRSAATDPTFRIEDVKGIRIGFTAWTWETIGTETQRTINGNPLPKGAETLIDSFNPSRPDRYARDLDAMKRRIALMRKAGAECIVFLPHWGEEYVTASSRRQRDMAQFLADQGVDIVFGLHPHVLQEAASVHSSVSGKDTLVFYSLGGFLSNMDYGTHGTKGYALDAIIARATVGRDADGTVRVRAGGFLGTTIVKEPAAGKLRHRVIPVRRALADPSAFGLKVRKTLPADADKRIMKVLGSSLTPAAAAATTSTGIAIHAFE